MSPSLRIILPACVAFVMLSCAGTAEKRPAASSPVTPARHAGKNRVYDAGAGFSIAVPGGYRNAGASGDHFMNFQGPSEGDFAVNFNVTRCFAGPGDIDSSGPRIKSVLTCLLRDYVCLEEGNDRIDGRECYWTSGLFTWGSRRLRNLQYFLRGNNGTVYVITFASPEASFPSYRTIFESTAATARVD
jgi:hypothetical protein